MMQDALDPVPGDVIKAIVKRELLDGAELTDLFEEFDDEPLGSASIAQVCMILNIHAKIYTS